MSPTAQGLPSATASPRSTADLIAKAESRAAARVLHLLESDGVYGAERVVLTLAGQASGDSRFPATIGVVVKDINDHNPLYEHARARGLDAVKLPLRNIQGAYDLTKLFIAVRRLGVRIIHAHNCKATIAAYLMHLARGTPILATCHLWFDDSQLPWLYRQFTRLEQRLYPRFPHVVAVSPSIAAQLREWGVAPGRLTEIENGIMPTASPKAETLDALRRRVGIRAGDFVVLNVGRLADQKAQNDLIDAAERLRRFRSNVQVLILGEGHLRGALEAQIARAGLAQCVKILGFQDNVIEYLGIADAFVLPSIDEGLPVALLEALAAAVPVVCTPVGAIPQLLENEVSALFVPVHSADSLATAIERLIADPVLRAGLAHAGQDAIRERCSADVMYRKYSEIYLRLTA